MASYTAAQRQKIAADHERWAELRQQTADRLAAQGDHTAAGIQQRAADERREIAAAARTSSVALEGILNPF